MCWRLRWKQHKGPLGKWAQKPVISKGYNSIYKIFTRVIAPSYPFIRPFVAVITLLRTSRGPPCTRQPYVAVFCSVDLVCPSYTLCNRISFVCYQNQQSGSVSIETWLNFSFLAAQNQRTPLEQKERARFTRVAFPAGLVSGNYWKAFASCNEVHNFWENVRWWDTSLLERWVY